MLIFKEFTFDAAHFLPKVPQEHKCRNLHGHTYRLKLFLEGEADPEMGWVVDFGDVKKAWKKVEPLLDHQYLNDVPGLENPTVENIAPWIWRKLKPELPQLAKIELWETPTAGVIYEGERSKG
jgi:6-pyruvoyltetrahydropterin/6-carboxytetrahydropterin synthase